VDGQWLVKEPKPHAELRLFCLPYAGGSASIYRSWQGVAPRHIQVCALELPGRGRLMRQPPFMRIAPLIRAIGNSIEAAPDRPFALFGHSMGGLIAFELARSLRERGAPEPAHLFVSATAAPSTPATGQKFAVATDAELKKKLRDLNGTPEELLENEELMALLLPMFRADFSVLENYEYREEPPLAVPITVFAGRSDAIVQPSDLPGWRRQSTGGTRLHFFPGDHFFVHSASTDVMKAIADVLG
jgi:medium-chain acyl-[acyl-carrier-protein] hydrolase